jgi:hypothetical protein
VICCFDVGHGLETLRTRHDGVGLLDHCHLLRNLLIECGFSLIEFLAAVTAHKAAAAVAREERQREEANEPTADLVRAQVAAAAQGGGVRTIRSSEAIANTRRQELYDTAVVLYERDHRRKT